MRIIKQSHEILPDGGEDLVKQIEVRRRICYKSEDKITKNSAKKFVRRIIGHGHSSVLEMGVITLRVNLVEGTPAIAFTNEMYSTLPKFLIVDETLTGHSLWITASVRSFREWVKNTHQHAIANAVCNHLVDLEPVLFSGLPESTATHPAITVQHVNPMDIPEELRFRHRHIAVKFVTNRAVTHEIVRHRPCSFLQESQRYCRYEEGVVFIEPTAFNFSKEDLVTWKDAMEFGEAKYLKLLKNNSPQAARTALPNSCKTEIIVYCSLREWSHILCLRTSSAAEPSMQELMKPLLAELQEMFPGVFDDLQIAVG